MLQFYFLAVVLNIIVGLILVYGKNFFDDSQTVPSVSTDDPLDFDSDDSEESSDAISKATEQNSLSESNVFFDTSGFRLVLLVLTGLTGVMKLVATVHIKDQLSVFDDFFVAIAGILGCFALFVEYHFAKNGEELNIPFFLRTLFVENRKIIGFYCIATSLLHFVFPRVMFL